MYDKQNNLLLCIKLVDMWVLDYLCPSSIVNLNSGLTRIQLFKGRGDSCIYKWQSHIQEVKEPHSDTPTNFK